MKPFLFLSLLITSSVSVKADYSRMTFLQVIDRADLVAESEIVAVNDSIFWIKLIHIVKGSCKKTIVKVRKFRNWPCAQRFKPYKVGQKELVALFWSKELKCWQPLGAGNEGELPLDNGKITFRRLLYDKRNYKSQSYKRTDVYNGIIYYLRNLDDLQSKVRNGKILDFYSENIFINALIKTMIWKNQRKLDPIKSFKRLNK